jgi:hypothetical protein
LNLVLVNLFATMAANDVKRPSADANPIEPTLHEVSTTADSGGVSFKDVWENRRVLSFCKKESSPK